MVEGDIEGDYYGSVDTKHVEKFMLQYIPGTKRIDQSYARTDSKLYSLDEYVLAREEGNAN